MENVNWGILGCGDVCERKSGPPMYKTPHSALAAVMRRDAAKAAEEYGMPGNLVAGANIAGFMKVADAMIWQGVSY